MRVTRLPPAIARTLLGIAIFAATPAQAAIAAPRQGGEERPDPCACAPSDVTCAALAAGAGLARFDAGDHEGADLCFERALAAGYEPDEPTRRRMVAAAYLRGEAMQYSKDDPAAAAAAYSRALALDPDHAPALLGRAEALQKAGMPGAALADLDRAIARGADWTAHWLRSRSRLALGDVAGAAEDLRATLRLNPGHAGARRALEELPAQP